MGASRGTYLVAIHARILPKRSCSAKEAHLKKAAGFKFSRNLFRITPDA